MLYAFYLLLSIRSCNKNIIFAYVADMFKHHALNEMNALNVTIPFTFSTVEVFSHDDKKIKFNGECAYETIGNRIPLPMKFSEGRLFMQSTGVLF